MEKRTKPVGELRLGMFIDALPLLSEPRFGYIPPTLDATRRDATHWYGEVIVIKPLEDRIVTSAAPEGVQIIEIGVRFDRQDEAVHRFRMTANAEVDVYS